MKRAWTRWLMTSAAVLTLLVTGTLAGASVNAQGDDLYKIGAIVIYCDELPAGGPYYASPLCDGAEGVLLSFTTPEGDVINQCYSGDPNCFVEIPFSSTIFVTIDESTIAPGFALYTAEGGTVVQEFTAPDSPPDGIYGGPFFMFLPVEGGEAPVETDEPGNTTTVPLSEHPVQLHAGDCDNLGEMVASLQTLRLESGEPVGDGAATPAMMSQTIGSPIFLDTAIDEGYAVAVFENADSVTPLACGELGGANNHDGALPIGLQEVDNSGMVGIALFTYNAADSSTTDILVLVSEDLTN